MLLRFIKTLIVLVCFGWSGVLWAAACTVNTSSINFGNYNVFLSAPHDSTGQITVTCSSGGPVQIALENSNAGGSIINRKMAQLNGNDRLNYNLYIDAARTTIWGNGSGNSVAQTVNVASGSSNILTVYGRIPPMQDANLGLYADTVTVNISF